MERDPPEPFVRLPASSLAALADGCLAMGPSGVEALREAGRRAGFRIFDSLGVLPETLPLARFFEAADRALQACGLGSVNFEAVDEGLIAMSWRRLPEAGGAEAGGRTGRGCPLATGILGGLLTRAAGSPMAVLEVDCAADGGDACWFLVGSEERLREIHGRIAGGASPHVALTPDGPEREDGSVRQPGDLEYAQDGQKDAEHREVLGDRERAGDLEHGGDVERAASPERGGVER